MNDSRSDDETKDIPSYTYWKRESDNPFSDQFKPTKTNSNNEDNNVNFGSAWNKAGTWYYKLI